MKNVAKVFLACYGTILTLAIVAIICVAADIARADVYFDDHESAIQVTDQPCPAEVAINAPEGTRGGLTLAKGHIATSKGPACAALVTQSKKDGLWMMVVFKSGSLWLIDFNEFTVEPGKKSV